MWPAVAMGAMVGAGLRYGVSRWLPLEPGEIPWATLWVNVAGSLLLGAIAGQALAPARHERTRALLGTGFCGALTTFSTFAVELAELGRAGDATTLAAYALMSVVFGLGAARAGLQLGRAVVVK
jgi:CrcB protein